MKTPSVSAILYAIDHQRLAEFYSRVFDAVILNQDGRNTSLSIGGLCLVVHQVPPRIAGQIGLERPPGLRRSGSLRLNFLVGDMERSRVLAKQLGGGIDSQPPDWALPDSKFYLGYDPEGNVIGCKGSPSEQYPQAGRAQGKG